MGYKSIPNLYQVPEVISLLKEAYYLEKIHGTSANVTWADGALTFFSGGVSQVVFENLFDKSNLATVFDAEFGKFQTVAVHGEAYGGSCQKMSRTYGEATKFIVFEVIVDGKHLSVTQAHDVATKLGLEFVHYVKGPSTLEFADAQRNAPSVQAVRNGIVGDRAREGVVIRPLITLTKNNDEILIAKHKGKGFEETKTPRPVSAEKLKVFSEANEASEEWVTPMRLEHVMDKLSPDGKVLTIRDTKTVIIAMVEDIKKESVGEIEWSKAVESAIMRDSALMFKKHFEAKLNELV